MTRMIITPLTNCWLLYLISACDLTSDGNEIPATILDLKLLISREVGGFLTPSFVSSIDKLRHNS